MYDVSERFLFQLVADRRESLQRSGRAAAQRPLRRALRAALARLGLASGGLSAAGRSTDLVRPRGDGGRDMLVGDGPAASTQGVGTAGNGRRDTDRGRVHPDVPSGNTARRSHSILTRREHEVVLLVAEGMTNAEIAGTLWISPGTVRRHLENVFAKLGVHTRTAAVARIRDVEPRS